MAKKKSVPATPPNAAKTTRAALARAAKKHYPTIKAAVEKALQQAGLHHLSVHEIIFGVQETDLVDSCRPPCSDDEECKLSSTGRWRCVPKKPA